MNNGASCARVSKKGLSTDERPFGASTKKPLPEKRPLATLQSLSSSRSVLLPELAPKIGLSQSGCRGFIGPVPPPLWMSTEVLIELGTTLNIIA